MRLVDVWCLQCLDNAVENSQSPSFSPSQVEYTEKTLKTTNTTSINFHRFTSTLRFFVRDRYSHLLDVIDLTMVVESTGKYEYLALRGGALGVYCSCSILVALLLINLLPWFLGKVTGIIVYVLEVFLKNSFLS